MVNPSLLEITTRPFLRILSEKYSRSITKISEIPESEFDEWKKMGFDWIWMMGIWQIGEYGLNHDRTRPEKQKKYNEICPDWKPEDIIGSPYAIVSYTINPELGKEEDILWLRKQLNQRGMKLMLDFVPNHTSFDSVEITKDNKREFFVHFPDNMDIKEANLTEQRFNELYGPHKIAYAGSLGFKPWTDVAQLNYMNEEMRKSRIQILLKMASQCDGIRCDVAFAVLNDIFWEKWHFELEKCGYHKLQTEFWSQAISEVKKKYADCVFLAESNYDSDGSLGKCGFDYVYDRLVFTGLEKVKNDDLSAVVNVINDPEISRYAHMIENHDEKRSLKTYSFDPKKEHCAAVISLTLPGLRLINQDQWCGYKYEIGVHLRRAVKEKPDEEFLSFYGKLFNIMKMDILKDGNYSVNNANAFSKVTPVLSWKYEKSGDFVSVFANYSQSPIDVVYKFNDINKSVGEVNDLFNNTSIKLEKNNELNLHLDPYSYLIIKY